MEKGLKSGHFLWKWAAGRNYDIKLMRLSPKCHSHSGTLLSRVGILTAFSMIFGEEFLVRIIVCIAISFVHTTESLPGER
eukprot:scaffold2484_cov118-Skeletonema_marinoi.AAC.4